MVLELCQLSDTSTYTKTMAYLNMLDPAMLVLPNYMSKLKYYLEQKNDFNF